jgi:hypothetical protein
MSDKSCGCENTVEESIFSARKCALDLDDKVENLVSSWQPQSHLAFWIEDYYNRERHYSTIGSLSPIDQEFINTRKLK